jgi:putative ABC transport system permease protein
MMTGFMIYSVDHETYQAYSKELGLTEDQLGAQDETTGILIDQQHFYNSVEQRYNNTKILKDESLLTMPFYWMDEDGEEFELDITVATFADKVPFGVPQYSYGYSLMLIIDEEQRDKGFSDIVDGWYSTNMYFAAKDPNKSEQDIKSLLLEAGMPSVSLYNEAKALQDNRNIITIISVFAYGFITLISLITLANVFNTISTNVNLRRREFAMLKSVGMTNHGFNKMLNYECIFYGLKALLYGLPVSVGITYLIYLSIEFGVEMKFYVPIQSILISIFSVFFVVFVSMMYSMRKIRNENVLDALKNENL